MHVALAAVRVTEMASSAARLNADRWWARVPLASLA